MRKIGFWRTARETGRLVRSGCLVFGIYWAVWVALALVENVFYHSEEPLSLMAVVRAVLLLLLTTGLSLSLYRFTVALERNERTFFPSPPVREYLRFLLVSLAVVAISMLLALVGALPLLVLLLYIGAVDSPGNVVFALVPCAGLFAVACGAVPFMRLSFATVAVAIGDDGGFGRIWRLTRGYGLKLLALFFLAVSPPFLLGVVWGAMGHKSAMESIPFATFNVVLTVSVFFGVSLFLLVFYQRLEERGRASEAGDALVRDAE
ncbi:hypothetical protein [Pseudodesulfovibrio sp.]|uniref:hypothetical protein n=1 Tax=Pseudodesulfovibrio sp. TaxID=2035812 RepID=UPI002629889D|nr:hypothetical protein [Pseudodesulfovibrio sp.]MDD3313072.1 hypothetical protein [Pseudodesulfovibrio sp.]